MLLIFRRNLASPGFMGLVLGHKLVPPFPWLKSCFRGFQLVSKLRAIIYEMGIFNIPGVS